MTIGKPEAATAVVVAPDDGHEDVRNMLSCVYTSNELEKLLHLEVDSVEIWDTVIPADLKRLFVSGTYMFRWSRKG